MNANDVVIIEYNISTEQYWMRNAMQSGSSPITADEANAVISQGNDDGFVSFELEAGYQRFTFSEGNGYFERFFPEQHQKMATWLESGEFYSNQKPRDRFPKGMRVSRSAYQFNRG